MNQLFVKCKRSGAFCYFSYEGQDIDTVQSLLEGMGATNIEFVTDEDYHAAKEVRGTSHEKTDRAGQ